MLVRVRALKTAVTLGAAAATAALSVTAAHAFRGHDGHKRPQVARAIPRRTHTTHTVNVPGPERVPSIAGSPPPPQPLTPPAQAPTAATPAPTPTPTPAPAPETSGGS
jgi:hypothetical protein